MEFRVTNDSRFWGPAFVFLSYSGYVCVFIEGVQYCLLSYRVLFELRLVMCHVMQLESGPSFFQWAFLTSVPHSSLYEFAGAFCLR